MDGQGWKSELALLPLSVSLHPVPFTSCQSRLTKEIQAKFCYYQ